MEPEPTELPKITREFLAEMVGKPVAALDSFDIRAATVPGENYMSVLYCIEIRFKDPKEKPIHAICKCYPQNPVRQTFLNKSNVFWNELQVYQVWIPTLEEFARNNVKKAGVEIKMPFAPLVGGAAFNFGTGKENEEIIAGLNGRLFGTFENYIAMVDMKRSHGFRLGNRFTGLRLDEIKLIMEEHAKVHATAWAYKCANGITNLEKKFKWLHFELRDEDMAMWVGMMQASCKQACAVLEKVWEGGAESPLVKGTERIAAQLGEITAAMFDGGVDDEGKSVQTELKLRKLLRVPLETKDEANYRPWRTIVHGDCWVNNLLFRDDPATGKAVDACLIDLQIMREACPTLDLSYLMYTSTTQEFRAAHMETMLQLYCKKFLYFCDLYGVEPYPGFSLAELKARFHTNKLMGFMMALMALPIMLKSADEVPDMEKLTLEEGADPMEIFKQMTEMGQKGDNRLYHERLLGVAQDLYADGII